MYLFSRKRTCRKICEHEYAAKKTFVFVSKIICNYTCVVYLVFKKCGSYSLSNVVFFPLWMRLNCFVLYVFLDRSVTWTATETRNVLRELQKINGNGSRWQAKTEGRGKKHNQGLELVFKMVFNATFNHILWRSFLLVEETGVPRENHRQTFYQIMLYRIIIFIT